MTRVLAICLYILIFTSCKEYDPVKQFQTENFLAWYSVVAVEMSEDNYLDGKVIISPPMSWQKIISLKIYNHYSSDYTKETLWYRVPYKDKDGILAVSRGKQDYHYPARKLLGVTDFSVKLEEKRIFLSYRREGEEAKEIVPLLNMKKKVAGFERFDSSAGHYFFKGLQYLPGKGKVGKTSSTFSQEGLCHKIGNDCEELMPNTCSLCLNGWYEVVGSRCKKMRSKFCGVDKCGGKNLPACPRGESFFSRKLDHGCFTESPDGFCTGDLRTLCGKDDILLCN